MNYKLTGRLEYYVFKLCQKHVHTRTNGFSYYCIIYYSLMTYMI